jgi:hypothetical protein
VDRLEAFGQHTVHLAFHGVAVAQDGDPHLVAGLADALDAALALLQTGGVPGKVDVDQGAETLQVEALGSGVGALNRAARAIEVELYSEPCL